MRRDVDTDPAFAHGFLLHYPLRALAGYLSRWRDGYVDDRDPEAFDVARFANEYAVHAGDGAERRFPNHLALRAVHNMHRLLLVGLGWGDSDVEPAAGDGNTTRSRRPVDAGGVLLDPRYVASSEPAAFTVAMQQLPVRCAAPLPRPPRMDAASDPAPVPGRA